MKRSASLCGLLAILLLWPSYGSAQETRGAIEGVVKDASGAVLPGTTVEAKHKSGATSTTVTNTQGLYHFPALPPGPYVIIATLSGFSPGQRDGIMLTIGQQLRVDMVLAVGSVSEAIQVRAESPIVDVKKNAVNSTITSETIDLIPKGRDFLSAITGIPGTNNVARAGGIMIDGATATENRYVVDGMDTTDLVDGVSGKRVIIDFIEQIQVQRSGYNAEYRAATGGVISAISKSGSNIYRGELGVNYTGPKLNRTFQGKVRPSLNISPVDNQTLEYIYAPRVHETFSLEPVGQLGGPILRNRLWFFVGAAPTRQKQTRTVTWATPIPEAPPTQTFRDIETNNQYMYTVTAQVSGNLRARFNGNNGRSDPGVSVPAFDATSGRSTANARLFNPLPTIRNFESADSYSGSLDWSATQKLFLSATGGWFDSKVYSGGGDYYPDTRRTFSNSNLTFAAVPTDFRRASGFAENATNDFNFGDGTKRMILNGEVSTFRTWKGQHSLKAGAQYERLSNQIDSGSRTLDIAFNWNQSSRPSEARRSVVSTAITPPAGSTPSVT